MAQERVVEVAAINITTSDPSPEKYIEIFQYVYRKKLPINVRGQEFFILEQARKARDQNIINGTFARFTQIDPTAPWFDIENLAKADDDDIKKISIPFHLRPNYSAFFFRFDADAHIFFFEKRGPGQRVSPFQIEKFLHDLFLSGYKDGSINVNLISDEASVDRIFSIPIIKKIEMTVLLPNPDVNEHLEKKIKERMRTINVRRWTEEYEAPPGESIKPDKEMKEFASITPANGDTKATGMDGNKRIEMSTKNFPLEESVRYDSDLISDRQAFEKAAQAIAIRRQDALAKQRRQPR